MNSRDIVRKSLARFDPSIRRLSMPEDEPIDVVEHGYRYLMIGGDTLAVRPGAIEGV